MFLAANQLRSQGYPGFANSHGKGGVLRAEGGGETRAGGGKEEGEMAGLFFSSGGRPMLRGRVILGGPVV